MAITNGFPETTRPILQWKKPTQYRRPTISHPAKPIAAMVGCAVLVSSVPYVKQSPPHPRSAGKLAAL